MHVIIVDKFISTTIAAPTLTTELAAFPGNYSELQNVEMCNHERSNAFRVSDTTVITSHNFPSNYAHGLDCKYEFFPKDPKPYRILSISFDHFETEEYDFLDVTCRNRTGEVKIRSVFLSVRFFNVKQIA